MSTGSADPFEIVSQDVDGRPMRVYRNRPPSLREVFASSTAPDKTDEFLIFGDRRLSFAEFGRLSNSVSRNLQEDIGIQHGDRVSILSANNPEWCEAFWGTINIGAVVVALNGWWTADEILFGLENSAARVLVVDGPRLERVFDRLDEVPQIERIYVIGEMPDAATGLDRIRPFEELLHSPTSAVPEQPQIAESDFSVIYYTSGTTGRPKGAIASHRTMLAFLMSTRHSAAMQGSRWGASTGSTDTTQEHQDVMPNTSLLTTPLFHVAGSFGGLLVSLSTGTRIVMLEGKYDPVRAMELIERERATVWATVPTMILRIADHPERQRYDLSSMTSIAYGGAPAGPGLRHKAREAFPSLTHLSQVYGMTESSAMATSIIGEDFDERPTSVGRAQPTVEIRIVGPDGRELGPNEPGEILLRGPFVVPGYWSPDSDPLDVRRDGWLHTGDVGFLDEDGYLYVTDRLKDMIIRGGENVYCAEVENRLVEHPEIVDAAVMGMPDAELGEEVRAVVQRVSGSSVSAEDVRQWVAEALAQFKVPKHVEITDAALPRNAAGKLLKNLLRGHGEVSLEETM